MSAAFGGARARDPLRVLLVTVLGLLVLVANPGYYSHDELQRLDYVEVHGFLHYLSAQVVLTQGEGFGVPVRPVAFFIQGLLSLLMRDYPVIVHLVDVLTHGVVSVLLLLLLSRFGLSRAIALGAACIFALNPMAIIAVGWSAALMDRWFVLFGLLALLCVESHLRRGEGMVTLGMVVPLMLAAVLSKETAIMLPGLMLVFVLRDGAVLRQRRFWQASIAMALPVLAYLAYRLPAILASFGASGGGAYSASLANVQEGLLVYLAYPFVWTLTEAGNWVFVRPGFMAAALIGHLALVVVLWVSKGWRVAAGYLYCYLLFLVPVLFIPHKGAHYLYASSVPFSMALAWLVVAPASWRSVLRWAGVMALALLLAHTALLQGFVYRLGACMNRAMIGVEAVHLTLGRPGSLEMRAEPGAPAHVLHRFATGRSKVGHSFPVTMTVVDWDAPRSQGQASIVMDAQCGVYSGQR